MSQFGFVFNIHFLFSSDSGAQFIRGFALVVGISGGFRAFLKAYQGIKVCEIRHACYSTHGNPYLAYLYKYVLQRRTMSGGVIQERFVEYTCDSKAVALHVSHDYGVVTPLPTCVWRKRAIRFTDSNFHHLFLPPRCESYFLLTPIRSSDCTRNSVVEVHEKSAMKIVSRELN